MEAFQALMEKCQEIDEAAIDSLGLDLASPANLLTLPSWAIFGGLLQSHTRCDREECGRVSRKTECLTHVMVAVPRGPRVTLDAALTAAQNWERLQQSPCPLCRRSLRSKKLVIDRWPSCLVIQVKRWRPGTLGVRWTKDQRHLSFEPTLLRGGMEYTLRAVVVHIGGPTQGHYICYVCPGTDWYRCDDTCVTPCTWADVLKAQAYIFFYNCD